ncbi:MAG: hypothetical protein RRB13_02640 [bacterium]|nr:hypothetical protein [bacterium]
MKSIVLLFTFLLAFSWPVYAEMKPETLKKIKQLYLELQAFKNDSLLTHVGLSPYCIYGKWSDSVSAINRELGQDQRMKLADGTFFYPVISLSYLGNEISDNAAHGRPPDNADTRKDAREFEQALGIKTPPPNPGRQLYLTKGDRLCSADKELFIEATTWLADGDFEAFKPLYLSDQVFATKANVEVYIVESDILLLRVRPKGSQATYWCYEDVIQDCSSPPSGE